MVDAYDGSMASSARGLTGTACWARVGRSLRRPQTNGSPKATATLQCIRKFCARSMPRQKRGARSGRVCPLSNSPQSTGPTKPLAVLGGTGLGETMNYILKRWCTSVSRAIDVTLRYPTCNCSLETPFGPPLSGVGTVCRWLLPLVHEPCPSATDRRNATGIESHALLTGSRPWHDQGGDLKAFCQPRLSPRSSSQRARQASCCDSTAGEVTPSRSSCARH